ncbi:MAG: bifunctional glutamate N-acetyltransferase/amino-acid acetyltransferase ArgJ [Peptococcaceae bacterium]|jgi:glutamate N-acetyltransferase/amino-acid N-acetyltransferase|nr:bifunctional glutamate N-acetyltransferase/amino-acid acetyltransferase ArgJ [Peptococcaceae bacterium]
MATWKWLKGGLSAPKGFLASGVKAGVKYENKYDVALIYSEQPAQAAGVFTRNRVKAHPLLLTRQQLSNGVAQAVVMNSGNANSCVGEAGDRAALAMVRQTAQELGVPPEDVLVASTGVIGVEMPMERIAGGIHAAAQEILMMSSAGAHEESAHRAALAIMTTDTLVKEFACELPCADGVIRVAGIAKGSGMIHPNMGTLLGFVTTDADIPAEELRRLLSESVEDSFNMVTVDGDTSTNDMVVALANGASGIRPDGEVWPEFAAMFKALCVKLAQEIARDGEGASKFLSVHVHGAKSKEDARKIAKSVCGSSLVKTAFFGEDANWGRILCAAGYAGADFDPDQTDIFLGSVQVAASGQGLAFSEEEAAKILAHKEISVFLRLHEGDAVATAWGCDLTHEYVTINGSYRT